MQRSPAWPFRAVGAVTLLMCTWIPACARHESGGATGGGGPGGGGNPQPAAPAAPRGLRLAQHPNGPPDYLLEWEASAAIEITSFSIYAAATPLTAAEPSALLQQLSGADRSAALQLPVDSGKRFFRIQATGATGLTSTLSTELAVDTAGRLAFMAQAAGGTSVDLFTVVPGDATGVQNLSALPVGSGLAEFRLAPDGRMAAFSADRDVANVNELFLAPLDAATALVKVSGALTAGGGVIPGARFSPDGNRIAFAADKDTASVFELFVVPTDGSSAPVKMSGAMVQGGGLAIAGAADIAWSPTGDYLAYSADQRLAGALELFVVPTDGSGAPVAVGGPLVATASLVQHTWSPDGGRIAFTADRRGDGVFELFLAQPDGSTAPTVHSGAQLGTADAFNVAWSPDGQRLAFVSTRRSPSLLEIYVTDASGSTEPVPLDSTLPSFAGATRFRWSPDGSRIAFAADRQVDGQFELFVADSIGVVQATKVSGTMVVRGDIAEFAWSPDSTQLAFRADRVVDERFELFVTAPGFTGAPLTLSGAMPAGGDVIDFAWSTEGQRLGFRADLLTDGVFDLFVTDRNGAAAPLPIQGPGGGAGTPAATWSTLGRR